MIVQESDVLIYPDGMPVMSQLDDANRVEYTYIEIGRFVTAAKMVAGPCLWDCFGCLF